MRKKVKVDENILIEMMADVIPTDFKNMPEHEDDDEETPKEKKKIIEKETPKEITKSGKKKKERSSYEELYLAHTTLSHKNRQLVYIDGDLYEKFSFFLKGAFKSKISMSSYITNIVLQHWEENKETIDELFDKNFKKPF